MFHDGTGFLININDSIVLVTCRHVISKRHGERHYFQFQGARHEIDVNSENYIDLKVNQNGWDSECTRLENDVVFYRTTISCRGLVLGSTQSVGLEDELHLVTHDSEGKQRILIKGKRRDLNEFIVTRTASGHSIQVPNLVCVEFEGVEIGHSGGVIIDPKNKKIVGMLRGSARYFDKDNSLHIITAQSIGEKYHSPPPEQVYRRTTWSVLSSRCLQQR